jgi:hypothetical protein
VPFGSAVKFSQTARIPENRLWTGMRRLGMAERAINCIDWFRIENRLGIICRRLRGEGSPLARPLLEATIKQAPVVKKRPSDQPHVLVWDVVDNDGAAVADAKLAGHATKLLSASHLAVDTPWNSVRAAQIHRAGNMADAILLWRTRVDDADVGIIYMFRKPIRFSSSGCV